jgi:predicted flap endonuclease-1-like 5' DNA nuclease
MQMNNQQVDDNFIMVEYTHPNRGQHRVIGAVTKTAYGFRGGGERFLVHKDDVAAQPQYYRPIQAVAAKVALPTYIQDTPPPPPVLKPTEPVQAVLPKASLAELLDHPVDARTQEDMLAESAFDLQLLPGITPSIEVGLKQHGLSTPQAIIAAGVQGLERVKYVGETKARMIYEYVVDKYGDTDDDD